MPINLLDYTNSKDGERGKEIDFLCGNEWEMPIQIETLEKWLIDNKKNIKKGIYVADVGFCPRDGALGGGCVITKTAMAIMSEIGMELYLSEYPPDEKE